MPAPPISDERLKETIELVDKHKGSTRKVAQELNISEGAVRVRMKNAKLMSLIHQQKKRKENYQYSIVILMA